MANISNTDNVENVNLISIPDWHGAGATPATKLHVVTPRASHGVPARCPDARASRSRISVRLLPN